MKRRETLRRDGGPGAPANGPLTDGESARSAEPEKASAAARPGELGGEAELAREEEAVEAVEARLREQLLRLAAEFDNYRKRESRERTEAWTRAKADLIEKLLPSIDDLSRVAHPDAGAGMLDSQAAGILAGVELVERKLLQALEREGLARIRAEGESFDPALHEAVLTQPTDDPQLDGRVAQVAQHGYLFADRLLRPAKVVVWKLAR